MPGGVRAHISVAGVVSRVTTEKSRCGRRVSTEHGGI